MTALFFGQREDARAQGGAVQVDPIKPTLEAPETKRLKLKSDGPPSNFAFKFNLRRYTKEVFAERRRRWETAMQRQSREPVSRGMATILQAGAHTRPLFGST